MSWYYHMSANRIINMLSMSLGEHLLIQRHSVESMGMGKNKNKKLKSKSEKLEETREQVNSNFKRHYFP